MEMETAKTVFLIEPEEAAQRIDKFLSEKLTDMTRSSIPRLLAAGEELPFKTRGYFRSGDPSAHPNGINPGGYLTGCML